jgi:hypothetical protein
MNTPLKQDYSIHINRDKIDSETAEKISTFFDHASNVRYKIDLIRTFFKNADEYQKKHLIEKAETTNLTLSELIEDASNASYDNLNIRHDNNNIPSKHISKSVPLTVDGFLSVYNLSNDLDVRVLKDTFNVNISNIQKMMNS